MSALSAAGLGILTQLDTASGLPVAVIGSIVFALGLGPVFILTTDLIVGTAPPERAGASSAMSGTGAESGGALGIAILGSIGAAVYRSDVVDAVPDGVPLASADAARDTLGGALVVAQSSRAASARGSSMPHSLRSRKDCSCRPASVPSLRSGSPPSSWPSYATSPTGAVPATRHGSRRGRIWESFSPSEELGFSPFGAEDNSQVGHGAADVEAEPGRDETADMVLAPACAQA